MTKLFTWHSWSKREGPFVLLRYQAHRLAGEISLRQGEHHALPSEYCHEGPNWGNQFFYLYGDPLTSTIILELYYIRWCVWYCIFLGPLGASKLTKSFFFKFIFLSIKTFILYFLFKNNRFGPSWYFTHTHFIIYRPFSKT